MKQRLELDPGRYRVSSAVAIALAAALVAVAAPGGVGGEPPRLAASGLVRLAPRAGADDFEDEEIAADWSLLRGTWSEDLGVLAGVPAAEGLPAGAVAAGFAGCSVCTVTADLAARNLSGPPEGSLVWLMAFAEGLPTNVLVALRPELDRVLFAQRDGGRILAGGSAAATIEPGVSYRVEIRSDGARFVVSLNGAVLFDQPSAFPGEPFGTVGFGARGAEVEVAGVFVVEWAGASLP